MVVNRKADQAKAEVKMERQIGSLASDMKANQEETKADRQETKANQAQMEESLKEEMRLTVSAIEDKMEATVHSIRSQRDERIQRWSENVTERIRSGKSGSPYGKCRSEIFE
jgi:hypothetical protein